MSERADYASAVGQSVDGTDRCGPDDVEIGDEVVFTYGPKDRKSWKDVAEVLDWGVRVKGGGMVSYRDIIQINPTDDRNGWSRGTGSGRGDDS